MANNVLGVNIAEELLTVAPPEVRMAIRGSAIRFLLACISEVAQDLDGSQEEINLFIKRGISSLTALEIPEAEIDWAMRHGPPEEE